ncbi:hypothetical protein LshimejAT787_0605740 [Lyophyllum shimeji]|uniref:Uncharacterized protein n=1 Tax=Lyophyllum shimeji TaxID=47721 RepID=A0A9P3PN36_LYOSH|nr:hypothetical protein LshimejAT787_0605740 [Lyophyllum shimeji]
MTSHSIQSRYSNSLAYASDVRNSSWSPALPNLPSRCIKSCLRSGASNAVLRSVKLPKVPTNQALMTEWEAPPEVGG